MTPNDHGQLKDSVQLQTAVRMFLEYLLEHKEILQTVMKERHAKDGDSALAQTLDTQTEGTWVNDFSRDRDQTSDSSFRESSPDSPRTINVSRALSSGQIADVTSCEDWKDAQRHLDSKITSCPPGASHS